jgi:hypothetical protein
MGKRELLLIVAFAVVGVLVYQVTAPAPPAGSRTVSVGGLLEKMRRAVRGNRASAEITSTQTQAIDAAVTDLRLRPRHATIVVEGEDRADVAVELKVWSNGYDDAEALSLAKQVVVALDPAGAVVVASIKFPEPGSQRATVTLKVPSRLRVRIDESGGATVSSVASVELGSVRGSTSISRIAGSVSGTHRFGELTIKQVGVIKMTTQASETTIEGVKDVTLTVRAGETRVTGPTGAVEIDANQADITLEKLEAVSSPMRVNANGGTIAITGLRTEARVDGRNTEIGILMDRAAPIAVYNEGEEDIELTPPPGGYNLDALVREGRLTPPELLQELGLSPVTSDEGNETRVTGAVGGGGPTITLRATRGDIVLRSRARDKAEQPEKSEKAEQSEKTGKRSSSRRTVDGRLGGL